jgi:Tfp pilus assembly protein FimV
MSPRHKAPQGRGPLIALALALSLVPVAPQARAQAPPPAPEGFVEGVGTTFSTTIEGRSVTFTSVKPVKMALQLMPEAVAYSIAAADNSQQTSFTVTGLTPGKTFYF